MGFASISDIGVWPERTLVIALQVKDGRHLYKVKTIN